MKKILILTIVALTLTACGRNRQCYNDCVDGWDGTPDRNPSWCRSYCSYYGD